MMSVDILLHQASFLRVRLVMSIFIVKCFRNNSSDFLKKFLFYSFHDFKVDKVIGSKGCRNLL